MRNGRPFWIVLGMVGLIGFGAFGEDKTEADYWKDLNLSFSLLQRKLTTKRCYTKFESEDAIRVSAHFHGCVDAVGVVLSLAGQKRSGNLSLIPTKRLKAKPSLGTLVKEFGEASVIRPTKLKGSGGHLLREALEDQKETAKAWDEAFASGDHISFEALTAYAKEQLPADKVSLSVGEGLTSILMAERDAHSTLQPMEYMMHKMQSSGESFFGIGATLQMVDGLPLITAPLKGSPALKAGLKANDIITAVDGKATEGRDLDEVVSWIRGPKDTEVKLTVRRGTGTLDIAVTRGLIETKSVEHQVMETHDKKVGYLRLRDFMYEQGADELRDAITEMQDAQQLSAVVLDLRDNPGGLLSQAQQVVGLFAPRHTKVVTQKSLDTGDEQVLYSIGTPATELPVTVLTNAGSASASEIVAGALQDEQATDNADNIFVVGERTFGKGTVQNIMAYDLETEEASPINMLGIRLGAPPPQVIEAKTIARFLLPRRNSQRFGVEPDIEAYTVPNPTEDDKARFRESDMYNNLSSQGEPWVQPRPEAVSKLKACLEKQGQAKQLFEAGKNEAIPPEYQVLVGLDTAYCLSIGAQR